MGKQSAGSASTADFLFRAGGLSTDDLKVTAFSGVEGLSELYEFHVELVSAEDEIDGDTLIGQACVLEIVASAGTRYVHGIVREFVRLGEGSKLTHYSASFVPLHWFLTRRIRSRVFEPNRCPDMTLPGVIAKVFKDAGIQPDNFRFGLQETYEPREYLAQYRESDLNWIGRRMEDEGVFYFFEHEEEIHRMVIADSPLAHAESPLGSVYPYRGPRGMAPEGEHVFRLRDARHVQIGSVMLDDFDFRKPKTQLRSTAAADTFTSLELGDYPGGFTEPGAGKHYAGIRLEEQQCARQVIEMTATIRGLMPGNRFLLEDHPAPALNREYVVTRLVHRATQPQSGEEEASAADSSYEVEIRAIPAETPYRPPRMTPRPKVAGSQTVLVVGPKSEEIYTDEYGRVKVQFHWDQEGRFDEHSSCWIRVAQILAGGRYGAMIIPRVGHEVIVDYLEGDPDQPIITGRVYNNDNMPPYGLPDAKTKLTIKGNSSQGAEGSNEIRFEDAKSGEQLLIHAEKDFHLRVKNDRVENIGNDRHLTVVGNRNELIKKDRSLKVEGNKIEEVVGDKSIKVTGKVSIDVTKTHSNHIVGDVVEAFDANHKHAVVATYILTANDIKIEGVNEIELQVGPSTLVLNTMGIFLNAQVINLNSAPAPPVLPLTCAATKPSDIVAPIDADTVEYGKDTRYDADPYTAAEVSTTPAPKREPVTTEPKPDSWIEIELVDDADRPVPGEPYELVLPDGSPRKGSLDANGLARVEGIDPGSCQICFPRLDGRTWEAHLMTTPKPPAPPRDNAVKQAPPPEYGTGPLGSGPYVVKQGDCLSSIALEAGHLPETIWDDPGNTDLRTLRTNPNTLLPSDRLVIPEKQRKEETGGTEQRHRFKVHGRPEMLRVRILDAFDQPRENEAYVLTIGSEIRRGTTDAEGQLQEPIPPNAKSATVLLGENQDEYKLRLGHLDPITEVSGIQQRLNNLAFHSGPEDGKLGPKTQAAIRWFQRCHQLEETGKPDEATCKKLEEQHGH